MSNVVDRSKTGSAPIGSGEVVLLHSVNTPNYPEASWIINPDLSAVSGVAQAYWKIVGSGVLAMSQAERDLVDAAAAEALAAATAANVKATLLAEPLEGLTHSVAASGLTLTTNIEHLVTDDITNVTADPSDTKYVVIRYVYNSTSDAFSVQAFEKTSGNYADLAADELLVDELGEFYVVANGTELVEVS